MTEWCDLCDTTTDCCYFPTHQVERERGKIVTEKTIQHTIVTGKAAYYVNNQYVGEDQTRALAEVKALMDDAKGQYTFEIIPETTETLTLHPFRSAGYNLEGDVHIYWDIKAARTKNKIQVIKFWREFTLLGLKETKDLVEGENTILDLGTMPYRVAVVLENALRHSFGQGYLEGPQFYAEHI